MKKEQNEIKEFMVKAGQGTPDKPTVSDSKTRILRVRLLLEEVFELAEASGVKVYFADRKVDGGDFELESLGKPNLADMMDALADINYVNLGAGVAFGLDLEAAHDEVQRSNMTKFIDGHRDEGGKWIKGPSYTPADLKKVLELQEA